MLPERSTRCRSLLACALIIGVGLAPIRLPAQEDEEAPEPYQPAVEVPQEEGPVEQQQRVCNDTLGYVGCANYMHGNTGRPGQAPAPEPDVWGALAVSASTLSSGYSWNYASEAAASQAALGACRKQGPGDCKIATTVADICVALAVSKAEKVFSVGGPVGAGNYADDGAMLKCQRAGGKSCAIQTSFCADGQRHELRGQTVFSNGNPIFVPDGTSLSRPGTTFAPLPARANPQPSPAGNDTAKFFGTWSTSIPVNGQMVTFLTLHDRQGYRNFVVTPAGNTPIGNGSFAAANGRYQAGAPKPNDAGSYRFQSPELVVCTNSAGQTVAWKRLAAPVDANAAAASLTQYQPPTERPGTVVRK